MVDTTNIHTLHKYSLPQHMSSALCSCSSSSMRLMMWQKIKQPSFVCFPSSSPPYHSICHPDTRLRTAGRWRSVHAISWTINFRGPTAAGERQQRLEDDGSNKSDGSIYAILLGLGVLGGIATWWYYPEYFNFRQGMSEEERKLRKMVKKFRLKLKKPSEMLKLCKNTLNNNIISYNENKRDLNKLGSELNVLVGEEVRTPFGRVPSKSGEIAMEWLR